MGHAESLKSLDDCQQAILDAIETFEPEVMTVALARVMGGVVGSMAEVTAGPEHVMKNLFDHGMRVAHEAHRLITTVQDRGLENDQ